MGAQLGTLGHSKKFKESPKRYGSVQRLYHRN